MRRLTIRVEAERDIRAAMTWYQLQKPGLEQEFLEGKLNSPIRQCDKRDVLGTLAN
jgi:hypothetical protein